MKNEPLSPALERPSDTPSGISRERRFHFLGVPLDSYSMAETLQIAAGAMKNRRRLQHVVVNVGKLVAMRHNPVLRRDVEESDLINIDGTGVLWGCRLLGHGIEERVARRRDLSPISWVPSRKSWNALSKSCMTSTQI